MKAQFRCLGSFFNYCRGEIAMVIGELLYTAIAVIACIECRVILKCDRIAGGYSKQKPRWIHVRNNLQGNIRIYDSRQWGIEVIVNGLNSMIENDVALNCQAAKNDAILDIQVHQRTLRLTEGPASKSFATADVQLSIPAYLILPGSKIFFRANSSGQALFSDESAYGNSFEQYEVKPVNYVVNVSRPCYFACPKACDLVNEICIPCSRGFFHNPRMSTWSHIYCEDIDECKLGRHSCSGSTSCVNVAGSYICKCAKGFFRDGKSCKACRSCSSGHYEFVPCTSWHDVICKKYSPPCKNYMYESHPYGISYDRYCEDVLQLMKPISKSRILNSIDSLLGSRLQPLKGFAKHVITDDLMDKSSSSVTLSFLSSEDKISTIQKSKSLQVDIRLHNVKVVPIFVDSDDSMISRNSKINGITQVRQYLCRNPVPDSLTLKHNILKDYKTQVGKVLCSRTEQDLCPGGVVKGESYHHRIPVSCSYKDRSLFKKTKLYCGRYVHLTSLFGVPRSKFKEGPIASFKNKNCKYLYDSCFDCKERLCYGVDNEVSCRRQCDRICFAYRKEKCVTYARPCSQGDISEWSITTNFAAKDIRERFSCYLKKHVPRKIFDLKYRVRIPNTNVESKWIRVTSKQQNLGQKIKIGIFTAEYDKTTVLPESIILKGQRASSGYKLRAYVLKNVSRASLNVSNRELKIMPSDPSLLNLQKWESASNCRVLSSWEKYLKVPHPASEYYEVQKIRNVGARFSYRIGNNLTRTKVKLALSNSFSVLKTFAKTSHLTVLNSTLGGDHNYWKIDITGNVSKCPGFLRLSIIEKTKMLLVLKQDVLVLCPLKYFHLVASIPKEKFHPHHKARMFIAYVFDGTHTYETHMERRRELKVKNFSYVTPGKTKKHPWELIDIKVLAKFEAVSILTVCFVLGILALLVYACIFKPRQKKKPKSRVHRTAASPLNRNDDVDARDEDKLEPRQMVPIIFLVSMRVAYSFLLTISFITILFSIINKSDLAVLKDFKSFVKIKVNQSKQISLALDQFRESEVKIMTDKAAFIECACDYHIGRVMRNMRDNITALVQLHDFLTFDRISKIVYRAILNKFPALKAIERKVRDYERAVKSKLRAIEGKLIRYAYRVYKNKWFGIPRLKFGSWKDWKGLNFLSGIGGFDLGFYRRVEASIIRRLKAMMSKFKLPNILGRLKNPLYPLANALLAPVRKMKRKVKQAVQARINKLKNRILNKIPCYGKIDMKKWERHKDNFDKASKERCRLKSANKFVEKIVDGTKSKKNKSSQYVIHSVRDNAVFNILKGDATEEEYESKQEGRLSALKRVAALYTQNDDVKAAMKVLRKHSVVLVVIFDVLLITYRNLKTYRFAFMMAAGYVVLKEHKKLKSHGQGGARAKGSAVQKIIIMVTKPMLLFFRTFNLIFKLIFTSLIIPVIVVVAFAIAVFYIAISFTYNGLNVDTLDKLGAMKLLSASLDVNYNLTSESLNEQAKYLNKFDLGVYRESIRVQTKEMYSTVKEFNADEIIRIKRVETQLCEMDKKLGCTVNLQKFMEKLEMKVKPCAFPVIKARIPDNIYDSAAYQKQLKYELKRYVDALRNIIVRTFYMILGIIGTILFFIIMSKVIFKFLKAMGMIRIKNKHIYHEIPKNARHKFD